MNTHPVRIALHFRASPCLLEKITSVRKVLELMSDREFKNRTDVNEVMSLKYHIIHFIVKDMEKQLEIDKKKEPPAKTPFLDRWIKWQLTGREPDGFAVYQENFLRQAVKEFPFPESQLFKMLVTNFSMCKEYGVGQTAAEYINGALNGQKGFKAEHDRREEYNTKMADANEKQEREEKELEESKVAEKDNKVAGTEKTNLPSDEN